MSNKKTFSDDPINLVGHYVKIVGSDDVVHYGILNRLFDNSALVLVDGETKFDNIKSIEKYPEPKYTKGGRKSTKRRKTRKFKRSRRNYYHK